MTQQLEQETPYDLDCVAYFQSIRHARLSADTLVEQTKQIKRLSDRLSYSSEHELYEAIAKGSLQPANELEQLLLRPKTCLFSGTGMFRTLSDLLLPELMNRNAGSRLINFWVPGCGTGREAYSLGLFLHAQQNKLQDWRVSILATDTSHVALEHANTARIPCDALDSDLYDLYGKGVRKIDGDYRIKEDTRRLVTFAPGNFYDDKPDRGPFDAILFRGHLKFWEPMQQETIIHNLCDSLRPGGYLILAHDESLLGLTGDFQPIYNISGFYKKR